MAYKSRSASASHSVRIEWDNDIQAYKVFTPYDKNFVDSIKYLIPHSDRSAVWEDVPKVAFGAAPQKPKFSHWIITERFLEPVKLTAELRWGKGSVWVIDKETAAKLEEKRQEQRQRLEEEARKRGFAKQSRNAIGNCNGNGVRTRMSGARISEIEETILDFVQMLSYEALKKAYQIGAMQLHPDRALLSGQDPKEASKKMSDFNAKWQEIERVFYQRS